MKSMSRLHSNMMCRFNYISGIVCTYSRIVWSIYHPCITKLCAEYTWSSLQNICAISIPMEVQDISDPYLHGGQFFSTSGKKVCMYRVLYYKHIGTGCIHINTVYRIYPPMHTNAACRINRTHIITLCRMYHLYTYTVRRIQCPGYSG